MLDAKAICLIFDVQDIVRAFSRALLKAGNSIAAKIAMIAITTSSSIKVKVTSFIVVNSFHIATKTKIQRECHDYKCAKNSQKCKKLFRRSILTVLLLNL